MKTGRVLVGFVLLLAMIGSACEFLAQEIQFGAGSSIGSGPWITVKRPLEAFNTIVQETYGNVTVELGDVESVQIEAPQDVMENLKTEVRGRTLYLEIAPGINLDIDRPIEFLVTLPNLEEVQLLGSGAFRIPALSSPRFAISLDGSGEIFADEIETASLDINLFGSGDINIQAGQTDAQVIRLMGSGSINTSGLESRQSDVSIPGSGNVIIWVMEELDISIDGSGDLSYYGDPSVVNQRINGSGNVQSLGEK